MHVALIGDVAVEPAAADGDSLATRCVTNDVPEHDHAEGHAEDPRHHITH
jgi:hypothetical protein